MALLSTLQDSFGGSSVNGSLWTTFTSGAGSSVTESGGTLNLVMPNTVVNADAEIDSVATYDLTGNYGIVRVNQVISGSTCETDFQLVASGTNNFMYMQRFTDGNLYAVMTVAGTQTFNQSVAYNASTMQWWRIRESGGTTFFDYSADGLSWTNLGSHANPSYGVTALTAKLAVFEDTSGTGGTAKFSNFNLPPSLASSPLRIANRNVGPMAMRHNFHQPDPYWTSPPYVPVQYTQTLTGGLTFTGAESKQISKNISAGLTFTGSYSHAIKKFMTAGLTFTGAMTKQINKFFSSGSASIVFDVASSGGGASVSSSPFTWSHTVTSSGSNALLVVCINIPNGQSTQPTTTAVTYGGVSMVKAISEQGSSGNYRGESSIWLLFNPPTGTNTVSASVSNLDGIFNLGAYGSAESFTGAQQSNTPDSTGVKTGSLNTSIPTNESFNLTTVANNAWGICTALNYGLSSNAAQITALQTSRENVTTGTSEAISAGLEDTNGPITPAGVQSMGWTIGGSSGIEELYTMAGISIAPALGGISFTGAFNAVKTTLHLVSLTAGLSFTGAMTKQISKNLASASLSFTGNFNKAVNKSMTASLSFTGSISRQIYKNLVAGLTFTGSFTKAIFKNLTASLTFIGNILKSVGKILTSASLSFTGKMVKTPSKVMSAALSFTGSLAPKNIFKTLTANLSFTGNQNRVVSKNMTAGLSFSGSMNKAVNKILTSAALSFTGAFVSSKLYIRSLTAASLSFTGSFSKQIGKSLNAGLTFTGSQSRAIFKHMSASVSFTGNLTKSIAKILTGGVLSFSGSFTKTIGKNLVAGVSFTGKLSKNIFKSMTAGLSFSGNLSKNIFKNLAAATLSFTGNMTKSLSRPLVASVSFAGAFTKQIAKNLTANLTFTGSQSRRINKTLTANESFAGTLNKSTNKNMSANLSFSGSLTKKLLKNLSAGLSFTGNMSKTVFKNMIAALTFNGAFTKMTAKSFNGSVSFSGNIKHTLGKNFNAAVSFTGNIAMLVKQVFKKTNRKFPTQKPNIIYPDNVPDKTRLDQSSSKIHLDTSSDRIDGDEDDNTVHLG